VLPSHLTLAEVARNPERITEVPQAALASLMAQAAALQVALAARLLAASVQPDERAGLPALDAERLLTPPEAAAMLGVTVPWLYRHAAQLPFARRLSRKALRFSEPGLRRWLVARKS
jgi:predicted DNA-binding transcriptional regulator AlpA